VKRGWFGGSRETPGRSWASIVAVAGVLAATYVLTLAIDPYLGIGSPWLSQLANAAIPLLVAASVLALTGRVSHAFLAAVLIDLLFYAADHVKMRSLQSNLVYADLKLVPELAKNSGLVLGFVRGAAWQWALVTAAAVAAIAVCIWASFGRPTITARVRLVLAAAVVCVALVLSRTSVPMGVPSIGWNVPMQISGAQQAGVNGNVLLGLLGSANMKPKSDAGSIAGFWRHPLIAAHKIPSAPSGSADQQPDIVIVQSESLFEPSQLCGMPDAPFLPTVAAGGKDTAQMSAPVFGSRTLQTEFEVLSGFPVGFAPNSLFAYYELVDRPLPGLPRALGKLGYRTVAIHPSLPSFWRRDYAIPALGFDDFIAGDAFFRGTDYTRQSWVSDDATVKSILAQLETASSPAFVFAVTIENHGPWGNRGGDSAPPIELPAKLSDEARPEFTDYLLRARRADQSLAALIKALEGRQRPTMVVFYGDHLPALDRTYASLCFKDGKPPQQHRPPLRVWANFPMKAELPRRMESYLMGGWVMRAAGLPSHAQFEAAASLAAAEADPASRPEQVDAAKRLYAHVATHEVFEKPVDEPGDRLVKVTERAADNALYGMRSGGAQLRPLTDEDRKKGEWGRSFPIVDGGGSQAVTLDLRGRVANITLRPYLVTGPECLLNASSGEALFAVLADGRTLFRSRLHGRSVNVVSLPVSGVRSLTFEATTKDGSASCDTVSFYVSHALCYSGDCTKPGTNPRYVARASSNAPADFGASRPHGESLDSDRDRLGFMVDRVVGSEAPYTPVRVTGDEKLFLHPTADKQGWMDFDVTGLEKVAVIGNIQPLDKACTGNPGAGIVDMIVSVDGVSIGRSRVDRDHPATLQVPIGTASRMRVSVDDGDAPWCDWFAFGFGEVREH